MPVHELLPEAGVLERIRHTQRLTERCLARPHQPDQRAGIAALEVEAVLLQPVLEPRGIIAGNAIGDRLRQAGYSVESARFSRGGVTEPHSAEARAKAKLEAKAAADKKEAERVKAENEAARKTS